MIVGLDFDGTLVTHQYPSLGNDVGAWSWLHKAADKGAKFILVTMRDGAELKAAAALCQANGIELLGANTNPTQWQWTMSPKPYCHLYIDDAGLGVPLELRRGERRENVDWSKAGPMLLEAMEHWAGRPHRVKDNTRFTSEVSDG